MSLQEGKTDSWEVRTVLENLVFMAHIVNFILRLVIS